MTWAGRLAADNGFMVGEGGDDQLYGRDGNDSLAGASGADYIVGGAGFGLMYGGADNDVFVITRGDYGDYAIGEAQIDTVFFPDRVSSELVSVTAASGFSTVLFNDGAFTTIQGIEYLGFSNTSLFIVS